ncbi:MAG: ATP-dependent helicase [Candidatus Eisenbacteria bacterium]|nr:ATP-dependent helicase [Candidatus Latescibacterota bacterium]MBD3301867.1 ATP-dependent helicase [Candidatus Eisenbacteria bacterium]
MKRYAVGDQIYHADYGEGMVVGVKPRSFFDILEVAFADRVRRLNSNHPRVGQKPVPPQPEKKDAAEPVVEEPQRQETRVLQIDRESVDFFRKMRIADADHPERFLLHLAAEKLAMTRGFESLLSLNSVRDLERYDFQIRAVLRVLRKMRGRALLADEVGLGKTIEAGLILKEYVLRGLVQRALVLAPVSLLTQWREELTHKFNLPFVVRARGEGWGSHPFLIASLDTAKTERNREEIGKQEFDILIVDEAHRLRNHLTQGWKFVDALSLKYLLLLTATPVQNDLRELYNLVTLLKPGSLGTYRAFRKRFMVRGDKRLPKNTRDLSNLLSSVMIRTTRSSTALKFPRREVRNEMFDLSGEERRLYDGISTFVHDIVQESEPEEYGRWHFLLLVLQKEMGSSHYAAQKTLERCLRVFGRGPRTRQLQRLVEMALAVRTSHKFEGLWDLVSEREGEEKVIVFTQFRRTLEYLERNLRQAGEDPAIFHGSLTAKEKDRAIHQFRKGKRILISTEAGGEGRNLQFCRTVVNYDLPWNPMRIEQRIGRVHRLGQMRDTRIYNFTARDTVEDYVLSILHRKINMFELVIGEMDMILGQWSEKESFEQKIFQIWASHGNKAERDEAFENLGEDMLLARKRYEKIQDYDSTIFETVETDGGPGEE